MGTVMVLPLLLSYSNAVFRYKDLGRTALQCLHELHSMEQALSIFYAALVHDDLESNSRHPSSPLQSLSAFDAYAGDCACQIRAQMLWDLVLFFRTLNNRAILLQAIQRLKKIKFNTAMLLEEIESNHHKPRPPNLSALDNYTALWERIDLKLFLDLASTATADTVLLSTGSTEPKATSPRRSHRHRDLAVEATWDPQDIVSVTRYLTMCHLLSASRTATFETGPPVRVKYRVNLQPTYEQNAKDLEKLQLTAVKTRNNHTRTHECMIQKAEAMQIYVSRVTTNWVKLTAIKERDFWPSFPEEFLAMSHRRIACVSAYVSLLVVRNAWIKYGVPIFAIIQHFCSHAGHRNIFCRIVRNPTAKFAKNQYSAIGENDWFTTEILSLDQVLASSWSRTPHIIMAGMSCEGSIEDFRRHVLESQRGSLSVDHRCNEADDCAHEISRTNISRMLAHCFAQHEQFSFRMEGVEDQYHRVAGGLHRSLGRQAEEVFVEARSGADEFGTGRSARLFTAEHFCLEYPDVLAKNVEEYGEKPRLFGCKLV